MSKKLWKTEMPSRQIAIGLILVILASNGLLKYGFDWENSLLLAIGMLFLYLFTRDTLKRLKLQEKVSAYLIERGATNPFKIIPLFDQDAFAGVAKELDVFSISGSDRYSVMTETIDHVTIYYFNFNKPRPTDPRNFYLVCDSNPGGSTRYSAYSK